MSELTYKQLNNGKVVTIIGSDLKTLVDNVLVYRRNNNIKPDEYNITFNEVKRQSGRNSALLFRSKSRPIGIIHEELKKAQSGRKSLSLSQVFHGAKAYISISKGDIVRQPEIDRRASICSGCIEISKTSDCYGCGAGKQLAINLSKLKQDTDSAFTVPSVVSPSGRTVDSISKFFCQICGCSLIALIISKMKHIRSEDDQTNSQRPDYCWMKKGGKNFVDDNS